MHRWIACLALVATCTLPLAACNVPVFRYALERWSPDYHVVTFNRTVEAGGSELSAAVAPLNDAHHHANLYAETDLVSDFATDEPGLMARVSWPESADAWYEGPWNREVMAKVVDSPLRRRVADDLLAGKTAVWIVYEGTGEIETEAAAALITKRLDHLRTVVELPAQEEELDWGGGGGQGRPSSQIPLQIDFAVHRLARDDTAEEMLIRQVEHLDPEFSASGRPMALVVFGRGRVIPLFSEELTEATVDEVTLFLCGACSCQVKALNPGIDFLFSTNWEDAVFYYPEAVEHLVPGQVPDDNGAASGVDTRPAPTAKAVAEPPTAPEPAAADIISTTPTTAIRAGSQPAGAEAAGAADEAGPAPANLSWLGLAALAGLALIGTAGVLFWRR